MSKEDFYQIVDDRLDGWELAELLGLTALDICVEFEDKLTKTKITQLKELLGIEDDEEDLDNDDYSEFD